ncbi:MAG: hypothetical protein HWN67_20155 [Candidatus Helarchaeota archaeon]|nr:hypothetical protein [Candidatus Helarchaeota archaeon]
MVTSVKYTFGDIPNEVRTRQYWPISDRFWELYTEFGYEFLKDLWDLLGRLALYDLFKIRLDKAIISARDVIKGNIKNPDKIMSYLMYPPLVSSRADLQQGMMKLLYGDSIDVSFVVLKDHTEEVVLILNGHLEDGIPVDWWIVKEDDELLERRHMKTGIKFKNLPKHHKSMNKLGLSILDILQDIRNERTPQWSTSAFHIAAVWGCGILSVGLGALTNWEIHSALWTGMAAKTHFGMPDYLFSYIPMPPIISVAVWAGRERFINTMVGLSHYNKTYIQGIEDIYLNTFKQEMPEMEERLWEEIDLGARLPKTILEAKPPDLKKQWKKNSYITENFDWYYPDANMIKWQDLGIEREEFLSGVFLEIDQWTPFDYEVSKKDIISTGLGSETKFY